MKIKNKFEVPKDVARARAVQFELKNRVSLRNRFADVSEIKTVAGCDVSYSRDEKKITAAIVVLNLGTLAVIETVRIRYAGRFLFPYVPGYLSFREGPVLLEAFGELKAVPDAVMFDGQGIAHPRGIGIASHMGVILDLPSVGCAKSLLYGECDEPPPGLKGAYTFIKDPSFTVIGISMRSKKYTNPIFVSQGHMMGLGMCVDLVFRCLSKYRIPEPLRLAHIEANE